MTEDGRYARQERVAAFGREGQRRLAGARIGIVGLGALGSRLAEDLARAGAGFLRLVDRDWVEVGNLHRQHLYTEADAAAERPKALAAAERLAALRGSAAIEAKVLDLAPGNADAVLGGLDLILDGSDNFQVRYLINDWARRNGKPWIYGACVGTQAMAAAFTPRGPCLRCVFPEPPPAEHVATCETAGILPPAAALAASLQFALALRIVARPDEPPEPLLVTADVFEPRVRGVRLPADPDETCPVCGRGEYPALAAEAASRATPLCGRRAVQLAPAAGRSPDLESVAARLPAEARAKLLDGVLLRIETPDGLITLFADGRAVVHGTDDPGRARALYDRWIGG